MNLFNFIKELLPRIDKVRVMEDMRITIDELEQISMPSTVLAADFFRTTKLKSDASKAISDIFYRNFDTQNLQKQANFVADIAKRLPMLKENAVYVQSQIEELMERDIINEGLTAKKAIFVRAAEAMSFISRYTIDLLNYVYISEASIPSIEVAESMKLSPGAIKHIITNMSKYARLLSDYGIPNKDFCKIVTAVPDVVVNSKMVSGLGNVFTEKEVDPFNSSFLKGFVGNPIYHIRLSIAEWQTARYKANKDKKQMLELRLLHLKMVNDKKYDVKIENEINYIQNRIDKIERYLRDVEESVDSEG